MSVSGEQLRPIIDLLRHIAAHQKATERIFDKLGVLNDFKQFYQEEWKRLDVGQIQYWSSPQALGKSIADRELESLLRSLLTKP